MDAFPSKQNTLSSKLPTQVEQGKAMPIPNKTIQKLFLFHNHRQAPERLYKSEFPEKEKVTFPLLILPRRWFDLIVL